MDSTTILSAGARPYPAQAPTDPSSKIEIEQPTSTKVPRLPTVSSSIKTPSKVSSPRSSRMSTLQQSPLSSSPPRVPTNPLETSASSSLGSSPPSQGRIKNRMIGNYCVERTIGRGQFGKVKLAYHKRVPDLKVAIKIINKTKLDEDTLKMIQREVRIIKLLNHPNIVRLYEVIETSRTFFLIMEYAEGGEVMDFIIAHGKIPEREAKRFFVQMVSAVQYCHSKRCCHRDIKPENLLLDSNMNIKIIDFGLSNIYTPGTLLKTFCGSPTYASPELILRKEYYGPAVDIWSMGVVLYVLICGYLPFDGHNFSELFNKILKLQYTIPSYVSPDCASLLKRMLVVDPSARATIDEIRQHPWLSSVSKFLSTPSSQEITDLSKIDKEIVAEMEGFGYNIEDVVQALLNNCYNEAAATYFLLEASRRRKTSKVKRTASKTNVGESSNANGTESAAAGQKESLPQQVPSKDKKFKKGHRRLHTVDACVPTSSGLAHAVSDKVHPDSPAGSPTTSPRLQSIASAPKRAGLFHHHTVSSGSDTPEKERAKAFNVRTILRGGGKHRRTASEATPNDMPHHTPDPSELLRHREPQVLSAVRPHTDPRRHEERKVNTDLVDDSRSSTPNSSNPSTPRSMEGDEDWVVVDDAESKISQSPGRSAMSSIISSFKSMWKKHPKDDNKPPPQPRVIRFAFSVNTTSERQPEEIMREVQRVLQSFHIPFTMKSPFYADCEVEGVRFSVEVCRLPRLLVSGIRLSRISGSAWKYKTIVKDLVAQMNL